MCNSLTDPNNTVEYEIAGEHIANGVYVSRLAGSIVIPGGGGVRTPNSFYWLYLGANQDGSSIQLYAQAPSTPPARDIARVIGAWGTKPGDWELVRQMQTNRVVQFESNYAYDTDLTVSGGSLITTWTKRAAANVGAFPAGLCAVVYLRAEARKMDNLQNLIGRGGPNIGIGFAQINIGGMNVTEGVVGQPSDMHFRTQVKGLTRYNEPDISMNMVRCIIEPRGNWYAVKSGESSNITVLAAGYELLLT